jgi:hypothetical protein
MGLDNRRRDVTLWALLILMVLAGGWFFFTPASGPGTGDTSRGPGPVPGKKKPGKTAPDSLAARQDIVKGKIQVPIAYENLEKSQTLKKLMATRKKNLGIQKSLDMIVKSNETFTVGGTRVSMQEVLEKAFTKRGQVYEQKLDESGTPVPESIKEYGIHVVRPGENIWNIHFNILKEYYAHQGIEVAPSADEPQNRGFSSGVGKILKFSETMVIIYNLIDRQVVTDINLLQPLSKIVVYNMEEVFSLLKEINYDNVDRIQFDGKNIWIPARKS